MATGTNNIAKIWDFYTYINNNGDLENAKTSLSKKYGTFTNSAAPASGWGTGLCPSKVEWTNLNSHMKKGDIVVNGTYANNRLVKFTDLLYLPRAAELSISPTTWTSPVAGGSQQVTVSYTNTDYYTVTSNQSWCTPPSGNQTATSVTISTSANTTTSSRTATVTFSCVGRDGITVSKTLTVTQYGKTTLSVNPTTLSFTPAGGKLTSTASPANLSTYYATSSVNWCTVSKSGNTISVSATVNSGAYRSGNVYVYGTGDYDLKSVTASIAISQSSGISSISLSSNANYGPAAQSNKTASVSRTNLSTYGVTRGGNSWITVSQNGDTVTYSLTSNSGAARTGTITVYGTGSYDNTKRTSSIYVSQSSGLPTISLSPSTDWTMTSNAASSRAVSVTYTNASTYSVTSSASWVTVSKSGNNVTLSVAANTGSDRSTTVRFGVTGTYSGTFVYDDIIVNQEGASSLTVYPTSWIVPLAGGSQTVTGTPTNLTTYYATSSVSWAKATKSGNTITISATAAIGTARNGTITLYGTGDSDKAYRTAQVSIAQASGYPSISVSPTTKSLTPLAATNTATVTRTYINGYASVASNATGWLNCTISGDTITYSTTKNIGSARTGTIYVHGKGLYGGASVTCTIVVSQSIGSSSISISPDASYTPDAQSSKTANVSRTNVSTYGVTRGSASWVTVSKSGNTVTYSLDKNTGGARTGTITVYGTGDYTGTQVTDSIYVSQSSGASSITISPNGNYSAAAQTGTAASVTRVNVDSYGVTRSGYSWLTVSKSGDAVNYSMTANSGAARTGTITVYGTGKYTGSQVSDYIYVSQNNGTPVISTNPTSLSYTKDGGEKTVTVYLTNITSNNYSVSSNQTWCTVTKSGTTLTIKCNKTNSSSTRYATISLTGTGTYGSSDSCTISVSQDGAPPSLTVSPTSWSMTSNAAASKSFTVTTSNVGAFSVGSLASWLTVSATSSTSVTLQATKNTGSDRSDTVYVSALGSYTNTGVTASITISQEGSSSLSVNPITHNMSPAAGSGSSTVTTYNMTNWYVSATSSGRWLSASKGSGKVNFSVTKNASSSRKGTIFVYGTGDSDQVAVTATITVNQGSGISSVITSDWQWSPSAAGGSTTKAVSVTNTLGNLIVHSNDSPSWASASISGNNVTLYATKNTGGARTATIYVGDTGAYDATFRKDYFKIGQASGISTLSISSDAKYTPATQSNKTATVTRTNVSTYGVTRGSASWVTVSKSGDTVTYSLTQNSGGARTATITVYGTGDYTGTSISDYIYVSQSSGASSLTISDWQWKPTAYAGSTTKTVSVTNIGSIFVDSNDSPSWASASISGYNVTLYVTKNTGSARTATIYVAGTGTYDGVKRRDYFKIGQESGAASITISPDGNYSAAAQSDKTATVTRTNVSTYGVTRGFDYWITVSKSGDTVTYSLDKNTGAARTATITVYGTGDYTGTKVSDYIYVSQSSGVSSISLSSNAEYGPAAQSNKTATVTRTNIDTYGVTRGPWDWITFSQNGDTVTYTLTSNSGTARTGTITVYGTGTYDNIKRTGSIKVSQSAGTPSISVSQSSITNAGATATSTNITVTPTNISTWYATSTVAWATPTKSGNSVTIALSKNTGSARTGKVYVHGNGDYGGSATASISISQVKGTSSISVSPSTYTFNPAGENVTATITLTNMDSYSVSESLNWLTTSKSGNYVTLIASGHTASTILRSGNIYFYGTGTVDGVARTASIYVTQNSNTIDVKIDGASSQVMSNRPAGGEELEFPITLTNVTTSYVTASVNWMSPSKDSDYLYIEVDSNSSYARSGYVYLVGSNSSTSKTASVYVSQNSGVSSISITPTSATAPVAGTSYKIPVTLTNASTYTISESYDWITTSKSGTTATITVAQNTSTSARTGYIYFYATGTYDNTRRSAVLTVRQPGATVVDPTATLYIDNLQQVWSAYGYDDGWDETIFICYAGDEITDVPYEFGLTSSLYYFEGEEMNTVSGTVDNWERFADSYDGYPLYLGLYWDDVISDAYYNWSAVYSELLEAGEYTISWPTQGSTPTISISPNSLSFSSSSGTKSCTASGGTISAVSNSLSWVTTSYTSSALSVTVTGNTSTSSRSGYIYVTVGGRSLSVYVYQSGVSTKSCTFEVVETGWLNDRTQCFDLQLSATVGSKTICSYQNINNGYDFNGVSDRTTTLNTVNVASGEAFKLWANVMTAVGAGTWRAAVYSTNVTLGSGSIATDLDSSSTSPALNIELYSKIQNGDKVILYLEADGSGSSGGSSTGVVSVSTGGWSSVSTPISGYEAYQSSSNYNVGNSLATCRVYTSGKSGQFTIYINNHSEASYDYTVAGKLDTALSASASLVTNSSGQGSSKGTTAGLNTSLSGWTAVSYTIPDIYQHWIDVAYRKDGSVNGGNDRGYLLVPANW